MFREMVDTFKLGRRMAKLNLANLIGHELAISETNGGGRPYHQWQSFEGNADFQVPVLPREPALVSTPYSTGGNCSGNGR